ncbi:MAG TPA: polysaccharide biosynthesis tyrosine autokinase [Vicinamibacteria bacterium]|nr:polysaccharide biosynthesis tyrosine autokinase [Vicinamibacteria bacterium]
MMEPAFGQDIRRYLAMLQKRRAIVITCVTVSMLLTVIYNYTTRPLYQATTQILIDRATPKVLPTKDLVDGGVQDFQTEYELLRGRTLAEKTIEKLGLQRSPELSTGPMMSPRERFQRKFLGQAPATTVDADGMPLSPAAAALRSRIRIEPLPGGRLVNLRFHAYDPGLAARVANTLAELYIEQSLDFRSANSTMATGWLSERLREQRVKVEAAERALIEYQERQGLAGSPAESSPDGERVSTLEAAVVAARMERVGKETALAQARSVPSYQLASLPAVVANPGVQEARSSVAELQAEYSRLGDTLGEKHPDMARLRGDIQVAQDKLQAEMRNALRALEGDAQAARAREAGLEASLVQARSESLEVGRKAIEYNALRREVEANKQLFQSLMSRSKETGLESELTSTNVRIIEKAEAPRAPISPNRTRNYQLGLLIGLGLGIALALLFEHVDNTVKTPEDVKALGMPFLGMVPNVAPRPGQPAAARAANTASPEAAVAEAYRVLRTNLIFSAPSEGGRALVLTSANPGEGKTTTTANLAVALALNGAKVLVVEADLRRPALHQHFRTRKTPGLSDLIVSKCQASQAIQSTRFKGLQVLPCGYIPPNPAELLGSGNMREIVAALRSCYDWVLIDTPPILAMADAPVLCPLVDGVILVVSAEQSPRPAVQRAVDQVLGVGGKFTGVVLNRVDLRRNSYYYGQYYGEYYRNYYAAPDSPAAQERRS